MCSPGSGPAGSFRWVDLWLEGACASRGLSGTGTARHFLKSFLFLLFSGSGLDLWAEDGVPLKNGRWTHPCARVERFLFAHQTPEPRELRCWGGQTSEEVAWVPSAQITWGHRLLASVAGVPEMKAGGGFARQSQREGVANTESWELRNTEGEKPGMRLLGAGGTKHRVGCGPPFPAGPPRSLGSTLQAAEAAEEEDGVKFTLVENHSKSCRSCRGGQSGA